MCLLSRTIYFLLLICVHCQNSDPYIFTASKTNDFSWIEDYISSGYDVNVLNESGLSPLMVSVDHQYFRTTELLLSNGADVNIVDDDGWSALIFACFHDDKDISELLLKSGADPHMTTNDGQSAFTFAKERSNRALYSTLRHYSEVQAGTKLSNSQLTLC